MEKVFRNFPKVVSLLVALLFVYAAGSKILDFENFQVQVAQSPLLSAYAGFISYAVIIVELVLAILLCIPQSQGIALYGSLGLMSAFTIYIFLILNYSDFVPCSCGGILEKMGWKEHLIFNGSFVILIVLAILLWQKGRGRSLSRVAQFSGGIVALSCLLVVVLFQSSETIIKKENNFTRRFLLNPIIKELKFDLGLNSYYFAGISNGKVYLGNFTAPLLLTSIDTALQDTSVMRIKLDDANHPFRNLQLRVQDNSYYLFDGSVPVIYRGKLGNPWAKTVSHDDSYFTQMAIMDTAKFVLLTQKRDNKMMMLATLDLNREPKLKLHSNILEKQVDGVFDVSGRLVKGNDSSKLVYIYSYRNQFLVMDDNLNSLNRYNTIDTTTRAKITAIRLSDGKHKMNSPYLSINHLCTVDRNYLFNESMLMGKIENKKKWKTSSVVDIYRIDRVEYVGSFYVDKIGKTSMSGMLADGKFMYVLIGNTIVRNQFRNMLLK